MRNANLWIVGLSISLLAFGCSLANAPEEPTGGTANDGGAENVGSSGAGANGASGGVGGCEGPLTTLDDCGACGVQCAPENVMGASCAKGICDYGSCSAGFQDCDGDTSNGCESDAAIDVDHCGACNNKCDPLNASGASCELGNCAYEACENGFEDCDADAANGCETELATDANHCGACGTVCDGALIKNVENPTCTDSICGYDACVALFDDCDQDAANGCEIPIDTLNDCGSCGNDCGMPANATPKCDGMQCAIDQCDAGKADCDSVYANGCEIDTQIDPMNCGMCGKVCPANEICSGGGCVPACDIVSVSQAKLHTNHSPTYGQWMADPLETLGAGKHWIFPGYNSSSLTGYQFDSLAQLVSNSPSDTWDLPLPRDGTGAVIREGFLYYNKANSNHLVKYDIKNKTVLLDVPLPNAGSHNTYHYQWGGYSDIDFAVDAKGLWVIYATAQNSGNIVVSKLNPATLAVTQSWMTTRNKKASGNAFMVCGKLYVTAHYSQATTTIAYKYDTNNSKAMTVNIPFTNPGGYNTHIAYNHNDQKLYSWDNTRLQTYDVNF